MVDADKAAAERIRRHMTDHHAEHGYRAQPVYVALVLAGSGHAVSCAWQSIHDANPSSATKKTNRARPPQ